MGNSPTQEKRSLLAARLVQTKPLHAVAFQKKENGWLIPRIKRLRDYHLGVEEEFGGIMGFLG